MTSGNFPFRSPKAVPSAYKRKFSRTIALTGKERFFPEDDIIVSKTDLKGTITYANNVFLDIASMTEGEAIGAPHSVIRHPDMPRAIFKLMWETIQAGHEIFAYVINMAKTGDHYWVFAHITPTFDDTGKIIGYHSNRRVPDRDALKIIIPLYAHLKTIEDSLPDRARGLEKSTSALQAVLREKGISYDEFIFSLSR